MAHICDCSLDNIEDFENRIIQKWKEKNIFKLINKVGKKSKRQSAGERECVGKKRKNGRIV